MAEAESTVSKKLVEFLTVRGRTVEVSGGGWDRGCTLPASIGRLGIVYPPSGTLEGFIMASSGSGIRVSCRVHTEEPLALHETLRLSLGRSKLTLQKSAGRAFLPLSRTCFMHLRKDCGYGVAQLALQRALRTCSALILVSRSGKE